jgi:hypothetical protein
MLFISVFEASSSDIHTVETAKINIRQVQVHSITKFQPVIPPPITVVVLLNALPPVLSPLKLFATF